MAIGKTNAGGGRRYEFDGTALAEDVVFGKTFFSDDPMEKQTGTLADRSGQSVTAASADLASSQYRLQAPAAAKYSSGTRLQRSFANVASDIGLTAAKLMSGNTVLGIAGTAKGSIYMESIASARVSVTLYLGSTANITVSNLTKEPVGIVVGLRSDYGSGDNESSAGCVAVAIKESLSVGGNLSWQHGSSITATVTSSDWTNKGAKIEFKSAAAAFKTASPFLWAYGIYLN
ncbi:MAG: hypothetical protein ACOX8S_01830 [Christensenellales bacterium]|jgi:hypothetical protein